MAKDADGRTKITVPDLGDFEDVDVIDVLVAVGDSIEIDTPLITLETDKATMDVPASAAGRIVELPVGKGDKVNKGTVIAVVETADDAESEASEESQPAEESSRDEGAVAEARQEPQTRETGTPAAAEAATGTEGETEIRVPDLGDFTDVEVIDVLVKAGDTLEQETPLITLETEKATMDVPATAAGRIREVHVAKGDRVSPGDLIVSLAGSPAAPQKQRARPPAAAKEREKETRKKAEPAREAPPDAAPAAEKEEAGAAPPPSRTLAARSPIDEPGFARAHASPSVRKLARELGVDLGRVKGSGAKGRITHDDLKAWVKQALSGAAAVPAGAALPKIPEIDFAKFGPVEVEPLGRIQRISGPRLHASWVNVPHVWQMDEADITELEEKRKALKDDASERGIKLTPLAFIVRAVVRAITEFPRFCASLDPTGQSLVLKKYLHVGFAADTPKGLVVPVIRDADRKDIYEIARELAALSEKARAGRLSPGEMQGSCFTISSLGGIGGTAFTPIINAPEVAILGVSRSTLRPVWRDGEFVPRLMLPYSLAYDHRVIDGADAVRFTTRLAEILAAPDALVAAVP